MEAENLKSGVLGGISLGFLIGVLAVWFFKPAFGSIIFILSLAMLPGFFITSMLYVYKLSKEKITRDIQEKKFDWDVEVNLKKMQILYTRYSSMIQTAGTISAVSLFSMVYLARDFPEWGTGHLILFPLTTILFILFLHLAFRWWFVMRSNAQHLKFRKSRL